MGKLIIHNAMAVNGAFESPSPDTWFEPDNDSGDASQDQLILADALVLGRKTYEGSPPSGPSSETIRRSAGTPSGSTACRSTSPREH